MLLIYTNCPLSQLVPYGFYDVSPITSIKYLLNPTVAKSQTIISSLIYFIFVDVILNEP